MNLITPEGRGDSAPSHISVMQPDGSRVPIPTLEVDDPSKMLGVYFCPAGDGTKHVTLMTAKGTSWLDRLQPKSLPRKDA